MISNKVYNNGFQLPVYGSDVQAEFQQVTHQVNEKSTTAELHEQHGKLLAKLIMSCNSRTVDSAISQWHDLRDQKEFSESSTQTLLAQEDLLNTLAERMQNPSNQLSQYSFGTSIGMLLLCPHHVGRDIGLNVLQNTVQGGRLTQEMKKGLFDLADLMKEEASYQLLMRKEATPRLTGTLLTILSDSGKIIAEQTGAQWTAQLKSKAINQGVSLRMCWSKVEMSGSSAK